MTPDEKAEIALVNLIDKGAVSFEGLDENGEPMYRFTEKLQEVAPELYRIHIQMLNTEIMALWEKGFIEMDLFDPNPTIKLSKKAFGVDAAIELNDTLLNFLNEIKRIYRERP